MAAARKTRTTKKKTRVKRVNTLPLQLTLEELIHLRDLLNVRFPPDMHRTVSQALAKIEDREIIESRLWGKIVKLCENNRIPLDDNAPDFVIALTAPPELGVFPAEVKEDYTVEEHDETFEDDDE